MSDVQIALGEISLYNANVTAPHTTSSPRMSRETAGMLAVALRLSGGQRQQFVALARGGPTHEALTSASAVHANLPNLLSPIIGRKGDVAQAMPEAVPYKSTTLPLSKSAPVCSACLEGARCLIYVLS